MKVKTVPEVNSKDVDEIFDHLKRITPEAYKSFTVLLQKEGYRLASIKTKRTVMPKVPIHRPVIMRVPIKIVSNDSPEIEDVDMLFKVERNE